MEDLDDNVSCTGFKPLFIAEDDGEPDRTLTEQRECHKEQSGLTYTGTSLNPSPLIKPYLQEMDDLLKSCEELTGIPFGYTETSMSETTNLQGKDVQIIECCRGTSISPQAYLSTSYIDTNMDGPGTEDQQAHWMSQSMGTIINRGGVTQEVCCQTEMPLTSAGNKLSETMVEYEDQLLGMLAKLESCMEETGMDFESQDWATGASQEYVHISKNPHLFRDTKLAATEQDKSTKLETQFESWAAQRAHEDNTEVTQGSVTKGSQQNLSPGCNSMHDVFMERSDYIKTERDGHNSQLSFSGPSILFHGEENNPMCCDDTNIQYLFNEGPETKGDINWSTVDNTNKTAQLEIKIDPYISSGIKELGELGSQMEECIEQVQQLQKERQELLTVVLQLRGNKDREETEGSNKEEEDEEQINSKVVELINILMKEEEGRREERKREIWSLRDERAEEERKMWKVNLERQGLQDELRKLKRRLFAVARDCAHNQAALNTQNQAVQLLKREEAKLQSQLLKLTEEGCQLRSTQQQLLIDLQAELNDCNSSQRSNTQEELTECRRHSCGDIQQYLQCGLKALEDRYEPMLLALLKRREATDGALVKAREQAQDLKAQLAPLKEEIQKMKLQRACLEEKLKLIHIHWCEDRGHYKETVHCLEESSRELKTELNVQKKKNRETVELRDNLAKQLLLCRAAIEEHNKSDPEKT